MFINNLSKNKVLTGPTELWHNLKKGVECKIMYKCALNQVELYLVKPLLQSNNCELIM